MGLFKLNQGIKDISIEVRKHISNLKMFEVISLLSSGLFKTLMLLTANTVFFLRTWNSYPRYLSSRHSAFHEWLCSLNVHLICKRRQTLRTLFGARCVL